MECSSLLEESPDVKKYLCGMCNPTSVFHRIIILILTCLLTFGSYFCYDNPAALQNVFLKELKMTQTSFMSLYAWYSWPNVVMTIVGGLLLDNILGIRLGTILFGTLMLIGQVVLSVGVFSGAVWVMYLGRFIFGIGAETVSIAQSTYAAIWFKDKQLNVVFGLQIGISLLGSVLNSNTMYPLYKALSKYHAGLNALAIALLIASSTIAASLISCIILGYLDYRASTISIKKTIEKPDSINFRDILKFSSCHWAICIICISFYSTVGLAQMNMVQKYSMTIPKANLASSLIYFIPAIASPIFGFGVDYFGKNLIWLTVGMVCLFSSHLLIAFSFSISPYVMAVIMGISYSIVSSSIYGLVPYVVPRSKQATAFGLMQALLNLGLGSVALISGNMLDNYGYFILELFFMCLIMFGFIALTYVFVWDFNRGVILNASKSQRLLSQSDK